MPDSLRENPGVKRFWAKKARFLRKDAPNHPWRSAPLLKAVRLAAFGGSLAEFG
jgi:hypothetical protein